MFQPLTLYDLSKHRVTTEIIDNNPIHGYFNREKRIQAIINKLETIPASCRKDMSQDVGGPRGRGIVFQLNDCRIFLQRTRGRLIYEKQ